MGSFIPVTVHFFFIEGFEPLKSRKWGGLLFAARVKLLGVIKFYAPKVLK